MVYGILTYSLVTRYTTKRLPLFMSSSSIHSIIHPSNYVLFLFLSVFLSVYVFVCFSVCSSVSLSLSVHLSVCLSYSTLLQNMAAVYLSLLLFKVLSAIRVWSYVGSWCASSNPRVSPALRDKTTQVQHRIQYFPILHTVHSVLACYILPILL